MHFRPAAFAISLAAVLLAAGRAPAARETRPPNELGRIPIMEYHKVDLPEARWTRTPEHFRADLDRLWKDGYRTVALRDVLKGEINIPAGTSPVILTFDDSSPGQFKYLEGSGEPKIDPDCAIGILEKFAQDHPGFGHNATFYVLTGASPPNKLFNQPKLAAQKLQYLASHGYEIGNHTLWHADLIKYPETTVREQIARAQQEVQKAVPGYVLHTMALPLGDYPKQHEWAISGSWKGIEYKNDAILRVAGGAAISPFDRTFDPYKLPRIQAIDSDLNEWRVGFERHPEQRFVSDGDPKAITVPRGQKARVRPEFAARVVEK